jgi:hypothetical protein
MDPKDWNSRIATREWLAICDRLRPHIQEETAAFQLMQVGSFAIGAITAELHAARDELKAADVGPSQGAERASCLVLNQDNAQASVARRFRLLEAFGHIHPRKRADLLEMAETIAFAHGALGEPLRSQLRELIREVYVQAGWGEEAGRS